MSASRLGLVQRQRRGGFVEDQQPRAAVNRARDREQLPDAWTEARDRRVQGQLSPTFASASAAVRCDERPIDQASGAPRHPAEDEILRDAQRADDLRLLVDDGDPRRLRSGGAGEANRLVPPSAACLRRATRLRSRSPSGSICRRRSRGQRDDLARMDGQRDAVERRVPPNRLTTPSTTSKGPRVGTDPDAGMGVSFQLLAARSVELCRSWRPEPENWMLFFDQNSTGWRTASAWSCRPSW